MLKLNFVEKVYATSCFSTVFFACAIALGLIPFFTIGYFAEVLLLFGMASVLSMMVALISSWFLPY